MSRGVLSGSTLEIVELKGPSIILRIRCSQPMGELAKGSKIKTELKLPNGDQLVRPQKTKITEVFADGFQTYIRVSGDREKTKLISGAVLDISLWLDGGASKATYEVIVP